MKKKEYEMLIRKIKSRNISEEHKLRELNDAYTKYLKSQYSDDAIKIVDRFVISKYPEETPPTELHGVFLQAAKYYREIGRYDEANTILDKICNSSNVSVSIQAEMERNLIKVRQSAENGKIDPEALKDIQDLVENDSEGEIETALPGKFTEYDLLTSYFENIPIELIDENIFPAGMTKPRGPISDIESGPDAPRSNKYIESLSAERRLQFFKKRFKIERARLGRDRFTGTIIFEIQDSDLVIAENFFKKDGEENYVEDYGKATYIMPKQAELDLIELSRGELKEKIGEEGKIATVNHTGERYYERLIERFNALQSEEYAKIEKENAEGSRVEDVQSLIGTKQTKEIPQLDPHNTDKQTTSIEDKKQIIREKNELFLNGINSNLGNIITPDVIEGLLTRSSYSFEDLYNKKLKNEIFGRLEIIEVPEEQRETEAQKVFLYIKMTKNASLINAGRIKGDRLDAVLDMTVLEYQDAINFYMKHKDDNISYRELVKGMKEYIETQKDPFAKNEVENSSEQLGETHQDINEPNQHSDIEKNPEEAKEIQEDAYTPLVSEEIDPSKREKTISIATRFAELIENYERITNQIERANLIIQELIEQYNQAVEVARVAKEQEEAVQKAMQDAVNNAQSLEEEQKELKDKISKIEELLR